VSVPFNAAKALRFDEGTIHVALVEAFPSREAAEAELTVGLMDAPAYRGIWRLPEPYGGVVHVFSDVTAEQLTAAQWTQGDA
jgi:hypothetical protein